MGWKGKEKCSEKEGIKDCIDCFKLGKILAIYSLLQLVNRLGFKGFLKKNEERTVEIIDT